MGALLALRRDAPDDAVVVGAVPEDVGGTEVGGQDVALADARLAEVEVDVGDLGGGAVGLDQPDRLVGADEQLPAGIEGEALRGLETVEE